MEPRPINTNEASSTTTTIHQHDHVVLKLKNLNEKKEKIDEKVSELQQSNFLRQSMLAESTLDDRNIEDISAEDDILEEQYEIENELKETSKDEALIDNTIREETENKTHEGEEVEFTMWDHTAELIAQEGTTILTAITTITTGTSALVGGSAILGTIFGVGALAIGANEIKKMITNYINSGGSSDHLLVIKKSVERAEAKAKAAEEAINNIQANLAECEAAIEKADQIIGDTLESLKDSGEKLRDAQEKLINFNKKKIETNIKKQTYLKEALAKQTEALQIIRKQEKLLRNLEKTPLPENLDEDSLKKFIQEIKSEIAKIRKLSDEAHDATLEAIHTMSTALQVDDSAIDETLNQLIATIALMIDDNEKMTQMLGSAQENLATAEKERKEAVNNATEAQENVQNVQTDLAIIKRARELEAEGFKIGTTSMAYGAITGGALTIGTAALLGPASIAFLTSATFGTFAATGVAHCIRKLQKTRERGLEKKTIEIQTTNMKPLTENAAFTITAERKTSQGIYYYPNIPLQAMGFKPWMSQQQGIITLSLGGSLFHFDFDQSVNSHKDVATEGAMKPIDQEKFSDLMTKLLEEKKISPQTVLAIIAALEHVLVDGQDVVVLMPNSIHVENLIRLCKK